MSISKKHECRIFLIFFFMLILFQHLLFSTGAVAYEASLLEGPYLLQVEAPARGIKKVEKKSLSDLTAVGQFWSVLIGIDDYDHWPKLSTAVKDIEALKDLLETKYRFDPNRTKVLKNKGANRREIINAFEWLVDNVGEEDNVFIYYAGHGDLNKVTGYWVPVEVGQNSKADLIGNSTIRDYIGAMKARHIYLVADSCFSGSLLGSTRSKPPLSSERYFQEAYKRISRQGLTSGGLEPVSDNGYDGHSIFSYYFLKGLRENAAPFLTASKLFDEIAPAIANNSNQTPISRPIRDVRDEGGEFFFVLKNAVITDGDHSGNTDALGQQIKAEQRRIEEEKVQLEKEKQRLREIASQQLRIEKEANEKLAEQKRKIGEERLELDRQKQIPNETDKKMREENKKSDESIFIPPTF